MKSVILFGMLLLAMLAVDARAQSPGNTYNWNPVFSGSAVVPNNAEQTINMTNNLTVVVHNNGTNGFVPGAIDMQAGTFTGTTYFGLNGVVTGTMTTGTIAAGNSGTTSFSPKLALKISGTGAKAIQSSLHMVKVQNCDDAIFVSFNASGGWTVPSTGTLNVTNATWSPATTTVHLYRFPPSEREGAAGVTSNGKLNLHIGLGEAGPTGGEMSLNLESNTLDADTAKAQSFQYVGMMSSPVEVINNGQGRRQIVSPSGLFDLADIFTGTTYTRTELKFYHGTGTKSSGLYSGSNLYKTIKFEHAEAGDVHTLTVTEIEDAEEETVYEYDESTEAWSLVTANGNRKESLTETTGTSTRTTTREIRDGSNTLMSKVRETYTEFAWGEQLTERVTDPDGLALTMAWSYGTTSGANDYQRITKTKDERGNWQRFTYDAEGRTTKIVSQYLDEPDTATEGESRVTATTYTGEDRTEVDTLLGQEVGRRHFVWSGSTERTLSEEVCVTAGAAAGAGSNLKTQTTYRTDGETTVRPDGTMVKTTRETLVGGGLRTTTETGEADDGDVVAGKRQVVEVDASGNTVSSTTYDIGSDLPIAQALRAAADDFGRPTEIEYLDGTTEAFEYDCCGLGQKTDRFGITTVYQHDDFHNVSLETRQGISISSEYDPLGRLRRQYRIGTDSSSILTGGADYDVSGRENALYSQSGTTSVAYSGTAGSVLTRTETIPGGATRISKSYPDGRIQETGGTAEFPKKYEYGVDSGDGVFTKEILVGESGAETEWVKTFEDLAGRAWKTLYPDDAEATSYWNAGGQLVRSVDPDGVTTLFAYDAEGEQEDTAIDANGNNTIDYGGTDRITRSRTTYLESGGETLQRQTRSVWGESGEETVSESDTSLTSLESWQRSQGAETQTVANLSGSGSWTITATANSGRVTTQTYTAGRLTSVVVTGSGGITASTQSRTYDPHGRVDEETTDGLATVEYTYTNADQVDTVVQGSQTVDYDYDSRGNQTKVTRNGTVETDYTYYPTGKLETVSGALAYPVSYTYDPQGRMKTLTTTGQAGSSVTTWNYDSERGWLNNKRYADNKGPNYTYTAAGRLETRTWARGAVTTYAYNDAGELTGIDYDDGTTPDVAYGRNRLGQISSIGDGAGSRTMASTIDGRPLTESYTSGIFSGMGSTIGYDALGRRSSHSTVVGSGTLTTGYGYDGASRLGTVTSGSDVAVYSYEAISSRVGGINQHQGGGTILATVKEYDTLGRLEEISATAGANVVSSHSYTYNSLNQRTEAVMQDGSKWSYGYDSLGQVTSAGRTWADTTAVAGQQYAYDFDSIGNRESTTVNGRTAEYSANGLNQYTSREVPGVIDMMGSATSTALVTVNSQTTSRKGDYFFASLNIDNEEAAQYPEVWVKAVLANSGTNGEDLVSLETGNVFVPKTPESYAYDDDGNLLSDGRWVYTWDGENRLTAMESGTGAPTGSKMKLVFGYDGQSRRVSKQVYTWSGSYSLNSTKRFVYDGWNLVAELDGNNEFLQGYVWGMDLSGGLQGAGGIGGLLVLKNADGSYYPSFDGNGNVMGLIESSNQTESARYLYGAFGESIQMSKKVENPFRFSTKYEDDETNALYYGYRFYDPEFGRWMNRDPAGENGGSNLYAILNNRPVDDVDILGLWGQDIVGVEFTPWRPGSTNMTIGEKIFKIYAFRTGVATDNKGIFLNQYFDTANIFDDLDEMPRILALRIANAYSKWALEQQLSGNLSSDWKFLRFGLRNIGDNNGLNMIGSGMDNWIFVGTAWWLANNKTIYGSGVIEARCVGDNIEIRRRFVAYRLTDNISARDLGYSYDLEGAETIIHKYIQPNLRNSFFLNLHFDDISDSEMTFPGQ